MCAPAYISLMVFSLWVAETPFFAFYGFLCVFPVLYCFSMYTASSVLYLNGLKVFPCATLERTILAALSRFVGWPSSWNF